MISFFGLSESKCHPFTAVLPKRGGHDGNTSVHFTSLSGNTRPKKPNGPAPADMSVPRPGRQKAGSRNKR